MKKIVHTNTKIKNKKEQETVTTKKPRKRNLRKGRENEKTERIEEGKWCIFDQKATCKFNESCWYLHKMENRRAHDSERKKCIYYQKGKDY